ncbi:MAG: hypothetical protein JXR63_08850 [Spirochaetales bacterium]|nr:hypothetical protein [Spirochaetales bacterium]
MNLLGIDIGSRAVKIAIFKEDKLFSHKILSTIDFYKHHCIPDAKGIRLQLESLELPQMEKIVATGYGRNNIKLQEATVINELKAHVYGILFQTQLRDFTLVDIGGQDFKIIKVEKGIIVDMLLNDKCAASSGRYLENMAAILDMPLQVLKQHSQNPVALSSTCAVFGESELIGKIADGCNMQEIAAGVNYSLYKRILPHVKKLQSQVVVLSGGVAKNTALVSFFQKDFAHVVIPPKPQINGALGCAYYGLKRG